MDDGEKAEIKLTIIEGIGEAMTQHYEREHLPLKEKVENHSRLFWMVNGAWAAVVAWFKFGGDQ